MLPLDWRRLLALAAAALAAPAAAMPALLPDERAAAAALGPAPGLWSGSAAAEARLPALLDGLERAAEQGLDPRAYEPDGLRRLARSGADRAGLERAATASFLAYARDVRRGRDLPGLPPPTGRYARLVGLLAELRAVAAADDSTRLPPLVYVTYLTAPVNADGTVHFRDDLYGRDECLAWQLGLN